MPLSLFGKKKKKPIIKVEEDEDEKGLGKKVAKRALTAIEKKRKAEKELLESL